MAAIEAVTPGRDARRRSTSGTCGSSPRGLVALGLLSGDGRGAHRARSAYKPFYMHRTSHWLGMDVHDVGAYSSTASRGRSSPGWC